MGAKQPKVILFDIGGVCVLSPFQAILDYELSLNIPPGWVNFSISKTAPNGAWHRLERGNIPMDAAFFAAFNEDLHNQSRWKDFYSTQRQTNPSLPEKLPPMPTVDGEYLFDAMMRGSRGPDPWIYPALKNLKESGKYVIAALSNTVIFPRDHDLYRESYTDDPLLGMFDVFVSSAHVGLRKPEPEIYKLALSRVDEFSRKNGRGGVEAEDVLFLDDIGENLREGRRQGFRTIKVHLGRAYEAVEELERITGLELQGDHPKVPIKPTIRKVGRIEAPTVLGDGNKAKL